MNTELEQVEKRIKELDRLIAPLSLERSELLERSLALRCPFQIGDMIEWGNPGHRFKGVVESITQWCGDPMAIATILRRDGSASMISHRVYPFKNPVLIARASKSS